MILPEALSSNTTWRRARGRRCSRSSTWSYRRCCTRTSRSAWSRARCCRRSHRATWRCRRRRGTTCRSSCCCCRGRRRRRGRSWSASSRRTVKPEYLIRPACNRDAGCLQGPCRAHTKAAAGVLPGCALIRLHSAICPGPRAVREKHHIGLDLHPVCPFGQDCHGGQGNRKSAACDGERLVHCAINLRARQARVVRVEENVETGDRPGAKDHAISVNGLNVPGFTCRNDEIIRIGGFSA